MICYLRNPSVTDKGVYYEYSTTDKTETEVEAVSGYTERYPQSAIHW